MPVRMAHPFRVRTAAVGWQPRPKIGLVKDEFTKRFVVGNFTRMGQIVEGLFSQTGNLHGESDTPNPIRAHR